VKVCRREEREEGGGREREIEGERERGSGKVRDKRAQWRGKWQLLLPRGATPGGEEARGGQKDRESTGDTRRPGEGVVDTDTDS
jgi:hypothetical protein